MKSRATMGGELIKEWGETSGKVEGFVFQAGSLLGTYCVLGLRDDLSILEILIYWPHKHTVHVQQYTERGCDQCCLEQGKRNMHGVVFHIAWEVDRVHLADK